MLPGAAVSWSLTGAGNPLLRWCPRVAVGRSLSSWPHGSPLRLLECPHGVAAGFPQEKWSSRKQSRSCKAFYDLPLEVAPYHLCNVLLLYSQPFPSVRGHTGAWRLVVVVWLLSHVRLFVTPWTVATRLLCPWNFPGKDTAVGSHFLLQELFPTQGSNPGLLHCRQILYHLSHQASPYLALDVKSKGKRLCRGELKPAMHTALWKHLVTVRSAGGLVPFTWEKDEGWFEALHCEAGVPNRTLSEASSFFWGRLPLLSHYLEVPEGHLLWGGRLGLGRKLFPSFIALGFLKLGRELGDEVCVWCGCAVGEWAPKGRLQLDWGALLRPPSFIPYNCGKKTKPLRMCSISQRDKIMSIFLSLSRKLT